MLSIVTCSSIQAQNDKYYVYSEGFVNCKPSGKMGAWGASSLSMDSMYTSSPFEGEKCLKLSTTGDESWAGVAIQAAGSWKTQVKDKSKLANLEGYSHLVINLRADEDYTLAKIGFGEQSEGNAEEGQIALTKEWKKVVFELHGLTLKEQNGLLNIVFVGKGTVYLDEVYFAKNYTPTSDAQVFKRRKGSLDTNSYWVYSDKWEKAIPTGFMGDVDAKSIKMNDAYRTNAYYGPKCIQLDIKEGVDNWRGIHFQHTGGWNAAIDPERELPNLEEYDYLEFYARTDDDDPFVITDVGMGTGGLFEEPRTVSYVEITKEWTRVRIRLRNAKLDRVNTLFSIMLPTGTLYLDEIRYVKNEKKTKTINKDEVE